MSGTCCLLHKHFTAPVRGPAAPVGAPLTPQIVSECVCFKNPEPSLFSWLGPGGWRGGYQGIPTAPLAFSGVFGDFPERRRDSLPIFRATRNDQITIKKHIFSPFRDIRPSFRKAPGRAESPPDATITPKAGSAHSNCLQRLQITRKVV